MVQVGRRRPRPLPLALLNAQRHPSSTVAAATTYQVAMVDATSDVDDVLPTESVAATATYQVALGLRADVTDDSELDLGGVVPQRADND